MTGALVIGGAHGSLAVVRSLGRRKIPLFVLARDHRIVTLSRYARKSLAWPGAADPGAADFLLDLARREGLDGWVVFPGGDAEAQLISRHYQSLAEVFRLTTPPWEVFRWAADKRLTYQRAAEIGIDFPRTYQAWSRVDLARLEIQFPVILKPAQRLGVNALTVAKAWRIDTRDELVRRFDEAAALMGDNGVVLQEMIPGDGASQWSYAAVSDRGEPVASLVAQRLRQYPIEFGATSTLVRSVEQPLIEEAACRFLRSIGYTGLAEVEFKYDHRDGRYKILDVNARVWAWASLGNTAGVDFPHLMWRVAMGEAVPEVRGKAGAGWIHVSRDLGAAIAEMRHGRLAPGAYLRSLRGPMEFAAFTCDDPLPGLMDLPITLARLRKRSHRHAHEVAAPAESLPLHSEKM